MRAHCLGKSSVAANIDRTFSACQIASRTPASQWRSLVYRPRSSPRRSLFVCLAQQMPAKPVIALVGLPSHHAMVPEHLRDGVKKQLALVVQQMEDAGYTSEFIPVTPEQGMDKLTEEFSSRSLDGICIGFGIRGIPQNTFFFEQVIEATRRGAPKATLVFNTSPDSTVDAAKRWFKVDG